MLKRLIKYDMKAISRYAIPMLIAAGGASFVCCAILYFTLGLAEELTSVLNAIMITGSVYMIGVICIGVMLLLVTIVIALRYYRSVFSNEGYLNMSIPVSRRAFLNSKIISSSIWAVITAVVSAVSVFVSLFLPLILYDASIIHDAISFVKGNLGAVATDRSLNVMVILFEMVVSVLNTAKDVTVIIASITLGSVLLRRAKLLASLIIYYVISFSEELFVANVKMLVHTFGTESSALTLVLDFAFEILVIFVVFALMYCVTLYLLEKRFNLE